ncbi:MAG TPA: hypothetical protein ENN66_12165 [Proteobacteria bacterium]|nr:hypothetical protein [Pseudomonadota bacterium]
MTKQVISAAQAYNHCDPAQSLFTTTAEVKRMDRFIGQERALAALDFGIGMARPGFNLYVMGPEGSGRHSVVQSFLHKKAKDEASPSDWCYVHNFKHSHKPLAIKLPSGQGRVFKGEMFELIDTLKSTIPAMLEDEDYRALNVTLSQRIEALYHDMEELAKSQG